MSDHENKVLKRNEENWRFQREYEKHMSKRLNRGQEFNDCRGAFNWKVKNAGRTIHNGNRCQINYQLSQRN